MDHCNEGSSGRTAAEVDQEPMSSCTMVACHPVATAQGDILAVDIGGTGIKAAVVDAKGELRCDRVRVDTPVGAHPDDVVTAIVALVTGLPAYGRIAIGFPGVVRDGAVFTAHNLGHDGWRGYGLARAVEQALGRPARLGNDADVQGLAVVEGKGLELVVTLGTGFGTALCLDGRLCPHLELAHTRFRKGETFEEQLGEAARKRVGSRKWNRRLYQAIDELRALVTFDRLWLGGGNARRVKGPLPQDVALADNIAGLKGGALLWRD